jgi:Secretion system C-terminal sorting domain
MKYFRTISFLFILTFLFAMVAHAQQFNGKWVCKYATDDDDVNGIGINSVAVGVVKENTFVALASTRDGTSNYLVEYLDADSANGRKSNIPYDVVYKKHWIYGFDNIEMNRAMDLAAAPDSLIYVASNDAQRNILVFQLGPDSAISAPYRISVSADSLWAITLDGQGNVYVSSIKVGSPSQVLVFKGIKDDMDDWSSNFSATPTATITLPDTGVIRGIATNSDGSVVYVSNYGMRKIYLYTGSPSTGYQLNTNFNFTLKDTLIIAGTPPDTLAPGPWGMTFMNTKNILFVACDVNFMLGDGYNYGRIYALNPNTGAILDTIDCAAWNYQVTGTYNNRTGGTASGYTSTYNVAYDENDNLYDQSFFGWTVDKWAFTGTLPTIPLTITRIAKENTQLPQSFSLAQNYPNPFNPSTTIEFSLNKASNVSLNIYDINGRLVSKLISSQYFAKGSYRVTFDASKLASGTYIYTIKNDSQELSKKMTLIK